MIKKIKTSTFLILIITLLNSGALVFYFKHNNVQISQKNLEINSLIDEVGQLKGQNQNLYQQMKENNSNQNKKIKNTNQTINNLSHQVGGLKNQKVVNKAALTNLQNKLIQKDSIINKLQIKKQINIKKQAVTNQIESILLLGENGRLTDTIMLVVIDKAKQKIFLISIPRDLYYNGRKINEYYEFYGFNKIEEVIGKITGITPHQYIFVNFNAFVDFINLIGGIDVNIPKSFVDPYYPTSNYGYKKIHFTAGMEHMNGQKALEYARSRKTTSDYDRASRQQLILVTAKQKIASRGLIKNINFYSNIFDIVSKNIKTNLNFIDLVMDFEKYKGFDLFAGNVISSANYLKASKSITGQFILLPKSGNFLNLQNSILHLI